MLTRRDILAGSGAVALLKPCPAWAQEQVVRVGVVPFSPAHWEIETIRRHDLDTPRGVQIAALTIASNEAARIAFQSEAVDAVVTDLLFAARLRGRGQPINYMPFLSTEDAVMVPSHTSIRTMHDLKGRRIGIAGGTLALSWLLLRTYVRDKTGINLSRGSPHAYGEPPDLSRELQEGELDAALLDWTSCARLEIQGYQRLIGLGEVARSFGLTGQPALTGYVFGRADERRDTVAAFAAITHEARSLLAGSETAWTPVRPLLKAEDEATAKVLERAFLGGIPSQRLEDERADAEWLYTVLNRIESENLTGPAKVLPIGLYWERQ